MATPTDRSPPPRIGSGDGTVPRKKQRRIDLHSNNSSKSSSSSKAPGTKDETSSDDAGGIFRLLDTDTRLKIFHYLAWQDLASAAPTSKAFRDDCLHPSLTQNQDRQFTVHFRTSLALLSRKLVQLQNAARFEHFSRLKIVWHGGARLENPTFSGAYDIRGDCVIPQVTDLELSFEPSHDVERTPTIRYKSWDMALHENVLWGMVSEFVPNLRVLTVSPPPSPPSESSHRTHNVSPMAPSFVSHWRQFETLVFRGQISSTHLRGFDMGLAQGLRCVDLDDCVFDLSRSNRFINAPNSNELFENDDDIGSDDNDDDDDDDNEDDDGNIDIRRPDRQRPTTSFCIFQPYVTTLERVSIRNARYYTEVTVDDTGMTTPLNVLDLPQSALIKFVRRATSLQWFRSDLTPDNVAMLQRERPGVTFES